MSEDLDYESARIRLQDAIILAFRAGFDSDEIIEEVIEVRDLLDEDEVLDA